MPSAKFKGVYCVSSEDKAHPATNLLNESNKKWRSEKSGVDSVYVILQFEKPTRIIGIDIGNEHSQYISALVGKHGWNQDDYKEILLTCSFMSPVESRNSIQPNRVRCFAKESLDKPAWEDKWDFLKILCKQPDNKFVQYGLSFVRVLAIDDATTSRRTEEPKTDISLNLPTNNVFAQFKIREDSSDSENGTSLFTKWQQTKHDNGETKTISAAAAIRDASASATTLKNTIDSPKASIKDKGRTTKAKDAVSKVQDRNRDSLLYDDEDDNTSIPKLEKKINEDKERIQREKEELLAKKKTTTTPKANTSRDNSRKMEASVTKFKNFLVGDKAMTKNDKNEDAEAEETSPKKDTKVVTGNKRISSPGAKSDEPLNKKRKSEEKPVSYKPFNELLEGVVLVISGIQNPDRASIRDKAIQMGARYKSDWDGVCTHLICAFKNTPKYNQVKGLGKIVTKKWIFDCYSSKKRLPWRRYALDSAEADKSDSEDEIFDMSLRPTDSNHLKIMEHADGGESSDVEILEQYDLQTCKPAIVLDPSDDEDFPEQAEKSQNNVSVQNTVAPAVNALGTAAPNIYELDTDEDTQMTAEQAKNTDIIEHSKNDSETDYESDATNVSQLMGDLFENKKFFFSRGLTAVDKCKLKRMIAEERGEFTSLEPKANYIISSEKYSLAQDNGITADIITPKWVYESLQLKKLLPTHRYKPE